MGWQGTLRDIKGRRIFAKMAVEKCLKFMYARVWRDDKFVWVTCKDTRTDLERTFRVNRSTGVFEPLQNLNDDSPRVPYHRESLMRRLREFKKRAIA